MNTQPTNKIISKINEREGEVFGFFFTKDGFKYEDFFVIARDTLNDEEGRANIRHLAELIAHALTQSAQKEYTGMNDEDEIKERSKKLLENIHE